MATTTDASRCSCGAPAGVICRKIGCTAGTAFSDVWCGPHRPLPSGAHPHKLTIPPAIVEGSVVRLKSGSPEMTVDAVVVEGQTVRVICFSGDDKSGWQVIREELPVTALEFVRA